MKGKSAEKKKTATPVVLIDESEELSNTIIIGKMLNGKENTSAQKAPSSNMLGGGFKYRPEEPEKPQSKVKGTESRVNAALMSSLREDRQTVYDDFGIIKQGAPKKKYRDPPSELAQHQPHVSKVNPWVRP